MAGLLMVKLWENFKIAASEVCLVVYFLRLVSAPASPATPGRRREEGGEQGEQGEQGEEMEQGEGVEKQGAGRARRWSSKEAIEEIE